MHVQTANFLANPNIGLFAYACDKYCLVAEGFNSKLIKTFEEVLKVPVHQITAAGTSLLGVFFNGNDEVLLVPQIMFDTELAQLVRYKIKYKVIKTHLTALGNNLLIGATCIASPEYGPRAMKEMEEALGCKVKQGQISGLSIVGSLAVANKNGCLVSSETSPGEINFLKNSLKVPVMTGTINFGSPYIRSGIVANTHGFIVGDSSGGPEVQNADEALGFLK